MKRISKADHDVYQVNVCGIPALSHVTCYSEATPGMGLHGEVYSYQCIEPPEPTTLEYDLHDRKGYFAPWLEEMADNNDAHGDIERQLLEAFEEEAMI